MSRHRWGEPNRLQFKTERACLHCDLVKVTRHEPGILPWIEWWRDGERIVSAATPPCGARIEATAPTAGAAA